MLPLNAACIPGSIASAAGGAVSTTLFGGVTWWIIDGAQRGTAVLLVALMANDTSPDLHAAWFQSFYRGGNGTPGALVIAALLAMPLFAGAVLLAIVRGDSGALLRLALVRLPTATFFAFASVALVARLVTLVDALSVWIMHGAISSLGAWNAQLTSANIGQDFFSALICLLITFAALLVYIELLVRDAAVSIVAAFIPLIAVATLWPGARHVLRKAGETLFALAISKFVIAFVLSIGAGMITAQSAHGVAAVIAGAVVLLLAAAAPFAVFRLLPGLEGAALGVVAGSGAAWTHRRMRGPGMAIGAATAGAISGGVARAGGTGAAGMGRVLGSIRRSGDDDADTQIVGHDVPPAKGAPSGAPASTGSGDGSESTAPVRQPGQTGAGATQRPGAQGDPVIADVPSGAVEPHPPVTVDAGHGDA